VTLTSCTHDQDRSQLSVSLSLPTTLQIQPLCQRRIENAPVCRSKNTSVMAARGRADCQSLKRHDCGKDGPGLDGGLLTNGGTLVPYPPGSASGQLPTAPIFSSPVNHPTRAADRPVGRPPIASLCGQVLSYPPARPRRGPGRLCFFLADQAPPDQPSGPAELNLRVIQTVQLGFRR
jgi:hypothetical protein